MTLRVLDESPSLGALYAKVLGLTLPRRGRSTEPSGPKTLPDTLPDTVLRLNQVGLDGDHIRRYRDVCRFETGSAVPATYPHVLAFPLHLTLMTEPAFPFAPMGVVHIGNRIIQGRPLRLEDVIDLQVSLEDLRPHPRGRTVTIVAEALAEGAVVWRGESVVLGRGETNPSGASTAASDLGVEVPAGPIAWRLPGNLGRRYAAVSGDRNPIHLYDATARLFGFRRHIAHGMWSKARAVAALESRLPDRFALDVAFKKPVVLPSTVTFGARDNGETIDFGIRGRSDVTHLVGRVTRL